MTTTLYAFMVHGHLIWWPFFILKLSYSSHYRRFVPRRAIAERFLVLYTHRIFIFIPIKSSEPVYHLELLKILIPQMRDFDFLSWVGINQTALVYVRDRIRVGKSSATKELIL